MVPRYKNVSSNSENCLYLLFYHKTLQVFYTYGVEYLYKEKLNANGWTDLAICF